MLSVLPILLTLGAVKGANILILLPFPQYSHTNVYFPIVEALAMKGHKITLATALPPKEPIRNVNVIKAELNLGGNKEAFNAGKITELSSFQKFAFPLVLLHMPLDPITKFVQSDGFLQILNSDAKYDLVMLETLFMQELLVTLGHRFNAPVINLDTHLPMVFGSYMSGSPYPFSYVPSLLQPFSDHMTFTERALNTLLGVLKITMGYVYYLPRLESIKSKYFKYSDSIPSIADMVRNTSLTIVTTNSFITYPRPLHKNVIEVDTQIPKVLKPLPQDLQNFMDEAKDGVVYFTLGSHLSSSDLKPETINILATAFSKLKQKVLWKWQGDAIPGLAQNIKLLPWFPQTSVLNHTNCKLFLTHGGYNSFFESMYFGIPIIGMPLMADQAYNIRSAVEKGVGLGLDFKYLTEESLSNALQTILTNPKFKENAEMISDMLRESRSTVDNAVFWIEHVIKFKGAKHLRPASLDLYLYQYLLLDVIAVGVAIVGVSGFSLLFLCKMCCGKSKLRHIDSKKKKN